tara:strand:- start:1634 stop:1879 length:246 start_codon:yes stop_codon:yes gene_type:complete
MPPKTDYQDPVASEEPKKKGRGRPKKNPDAEVKGKKAPAKKGGGDWKGHLAKTFAAGKKKNPKYKYSEAMKDAAKTYKGKK